MYLQLVLCRVAVLSLFRADEIRDANLMLVLFFTLFLHRI